MLTCYLYCRILFNNSKHIRVEFLELEQRDRCVLNKAVYARRYNTKFVFMGFVCEVQFFIDFQYINATMPGVIICSQGRCCKISVVINDSLDIYIFIGVISEENTGVYLYNSRVNVRINYSYKLTVF